MTDSEGMPKGDPRLRELDAMLQCICYCCVCKVTPQKARELWAYRAKCGWARLITMPTANRFLRWSQQTSQKSTRVSTSLGEGDIS